MLPGMARRIDNHFLSKGQGNFAAFGALDWISGTSVGGDLIDDMKAEWDKRDGDEKVGEAADGVQGFVDGMGDKLKKGGRRRKASGKS